LVEAYPPVVILQRVFFVLVLSLKLVERIAPRLETHCHGVLVFLQKIVLNLLALEVVESFESVVEVLTLDLVVDLFY
jgi:hypothetical protein